MFLGSVFHFQHLFRNLRKAKQSIELESWTDSQLPFGMEEMDTQVMAPEDIDKAIDRFQHEMVDPVPDDDVPVAACLDFMFVLLTLCFADVFPQTGPLQIVEIFF